MRTFIHLAVGATTLAMVGCGATAPETDMAVAYGYEVTETTPPGPAPTQPADPDGLVLLDDTVSMRESDGEHGFGGDETSATNCVLVVDEDTTIDDIADKVIGIDVADLRSENGLREHSPVEAGLELDICVNNGIWDVYGTARVPPSGDYAKQLQTALNTLFESTAMLPLAVDGDAGKLTQQATCAARAVIGLRVSTGYPIPDSADSNTILAATPSDMRVPEGAPTDAPRWLLIDKTCQVMFAGEYDTLVQVYPTSTGAPGYETTVGTFEGYRFDPALDRDGWHDSSAYPSDVDDPNNGNMYKPIYFFEGEAIHGAGYIPADPRSKGCARTFPQHQDQLIAWLGLDELDDVTWKTDVIGLEVVVRGHYLTPAGEPLPEPDIIIPPAYEQSDSSEPPAENESDEATEA